MFHHYFLSFSIMLSIIFHHVPSFSVIFHDFPWVLGRFRYRLPIVYTFDDLQLGRALRVATLPQGPRQEIVGGATEAQAKGAQHLVRRS